MMGGGLLTDTPRFTLSLYGKFAFRAEKYFFLIANLGTHAGILGISMPR